MFVSYDRDERPDIVSTAQVWSFWIRFAYSFILVAIVAVYAPGAEWVNAYPDTWLVRGRSMPFADSPLSRKRSSG